ncbi:MAG: putative transport system ATP-binding protein [Patescibacteria group bacterium]|nr:putative transport system ATP-binding protein [Patescibacteria group bacterium]
MLELRNITKTYRMGFEDLQVLKKVSMRVKDGEFVAIMGPSGSGKSTLMNIIGILDAPSGGEYELDGVPVEKLSGDEQSEFRGKKVGFIFQGYNLIPRLTALEQVMLPLAYQGIGKSERKARALAALERVGLTDKIDNKPNEMSGGQMQRVAIARAIVGKPSIILADEPTGALDTKTGTEILDILKSLHKEGKTVILITHDPHIGAMAERIVHMKDGMIERR